MKRWTQIEDEVILNNFTLLSYKDIAQKINRNENSVKLRVYRLGLKKRKYIKRIIGSNERVCSACKGIKLNSEFYASKQTADGLTPRCKKCMSKATVRSHKKNWENLKLEVFQAYGGCFCKCCGESHIELLTLDHIRNDGKLHRLSLGRCYEIYKDVKQKGFPLGFQVLCYNCNIAKFKCGQCPHSRI